MKDIETSVQSGGASSPNGSERKRRRVSIGALAELFITFFKIGLFTFGGGYAMLSLIERETVDNKHWITQPELADMIIIAESTPGAISVNTATYVGYKQCGILGGIIATLGVIFPSLIIISAVFYFFDAFRENVWLAGAFKGIRAAVVTLIFNAAVKMFKPMDKNVVTILVAIAVGVCASIFTVNVIYYILIGGAGGIIYYFLKDGKKKNEGD